MPFLGLVAALFIRCRDVGLQRVRFVEMAFFLHRVDSYFDYEFHHVTVFWGVGLVISREVDRKIQVTQDSKILGTE